MMPDWTPDGSTVNSFYSYDTTDNVIMEGTCRQNPYYTKINHLDASDSTDANFIWFDREIYVMDWYTE